MQGAREIAAVLGALFAYVTTVLPRVRRELRQLGPLPKEKARNAEAVAVFATLAPRRSRAAAVRAIVALQVAIDLRDELEEAGGETGSTARIDLLEKRWRLEVAALPSYDKVRPRLEQAVEVCKKGQAYTHRAAGAGSEQLRRWIEGLRPSPAYRWWEAAAGASSSVAAHALIAVAADPASTATVAAHIDAAYYLPIGSLTVLLDDLVDREEDRELGEHNYVDYYSSPGEAAERFGRIVEESHELIEPLPRARRHQAILAGVVAFYLSDGRAQTPYAQPIRERLLENLGPGARILVGFMRLRRLRERKGPGQVGNSPEP